MPSPDSVDWTGLVELLRQPIREYGFHGVIEAVENALRLEAMDMRNRRDMTGAAIRVHQADALMKLRNERLA